LTHINFTHRRCAVQSAEPVRERSCACAQPISAGPPPAKRHMDDHKEQSVMANANITGNPDDDVTEEPIPVMQQLLDNPFLLLFIGIAMPTVLYIVWGVMEIVGIPVAK
jgi:hypothetical protein